MNTIKIRQITPNTYAEVHDIEVEDVHHYILDNGVVSHNSGPIFAASIVAVMKKLKLKEDEDGNKTSDVKGIRSSISVAKTRYAKPFEKIEVKIPYETGMNPYSGLLELCEACGIVTKDGNKVKYVAKDGTEYKEFRKNFGPEILDIIMAEWDDDVVQIDVDSE